MRITLLIIFGFLATAGGGFYVLMRTIQGDVERQYSQAAEEPLVDLSHLLASLVEQDLRDGEVDADRFREGFAAAYRREFSARIHQLEKTRLDTQVYVTDRDGIVRFDSDGGRREGEDYSRQNDVYLTLRGKYGARASRTDPEDSRSTVFHVAAPIHWQGEIVGVLTVSRPETAMSAFVDETRSHILRSSLITGGAVAVLGALWTYWLLSPIGALTDRARRVTRGEQAAVPEAGHAELRDLSRAIEEMRRELEGRHYVENYVQALTHELKSPLAAIRGAAELLDESMPPEQRARFLANIRAETDRSEDLVRRLLQLAALERQSDLERRETIDLSALVAEESAKLIPLATAKGVTIGFASPPASGEATLVGDPIMLAIAIRNLVTNAIDFSPSGGAVDLRLSRADGALRLTVEDGGPGVPDYAAGRIFERFYSLKHSATGRKGSGLGLCLARETARLHGGDVTLENRDPAPGARAALSLPASAQGSSA
jgi:two-component system sensor histidine kinase CreC